ncbi:flagellar biosynthesis anti-sigma factor FlgM [Shewanella sp. BC20]|uniref:flagellar biosynthesis anti-sigma factor FlgM n=1 Tax=Shewanella sp. BC20 TaxID=2004459 RepID=UPI000D65482D|nr:flagellar biosynthesis anti-sigma factor FlgM [Shewanella sp. BC20]PWF62565.1 flagellar biosynthesis anti-sigma factor FlgM [Shewanella sp. BC20]
MEINKINSTLSAGFNTSKSVDTLKKTLVSDHLSTSNTQDISDDWQLLEQTHKELQTVSDVDMDKVAAIRQAMSNDSFELSLDKIAEKILIQHGK